MEHIRGAKCNFRQLVIGGVLMAALVEMHHPTFMLNLQKLPYKLHDQMSTSRDWLSEVAVAGFRPARRVIFVPEDKAWNRKQVTSTYYFFVDLVATFTNNRNLNKDDFTIMVPHRRHKLRDMIHGSIGFSRVREALELEDYVRHENFVATTVIGT